MPARSTFRVAPSIPALAAFLVVAPGIAHAEPSELRHDVRVDLPILVTGAVGWVATELAKDGLAPDACRWCDRDETGNDTLNALDAGARDGLRWSDTGAADAVSNVTAFGLAPLGAFGLVALAAWDEDALEGWPVDALIIAQTVAIAADVNQLVKFAVGRERPFVHALPASEKPRTAKPSDNDLSFYSGHTSLVFSLAAASGTVASMRGYRMAPWIWASGMTVAATTGYLRIAADKHYLTDVLTGAALGTALGVALPYVFHGPTSTMSASVSGQASSRSAAIQFGFVW